MFQTPPNLVMSLPSSFKIVNPLKLLQDPNSTYHNSKKKAKKKKRAASVFLQEVTSIPIPFIVLLIYLSLTGGRSFNKTHRMTGKKWILTFPQAYNIILFLCKIQPSKDAKSCLNTLGVCLQWNFRIRMVYKNFLM